MVDVVLVSEHVRSCANKWGGERRRCAAEKASQKMRLHSRNREFSYAPFQPEEVARCCRVV